MIFVICQAINITAIMSKQQNGKGVIREECPNGTSCEYFHTRIYHILHVKCNFDNNGTGCKRKLPTDRWEDCTLHCEKFNHSKVPQTSTDDSKPKTCAFEIEEKQDGISFFRICKRSTVRDYDLCSVCFGRDEGKKFLEKEAGSEIKIWKADEPGIHDPKGKATKASVFKPAIYAE